MWYTPGFKIRNDLLLTQTSVEKQVNPEIVQEPPTPIGDCSSSMARWCKLTETTEAGVMSLPSYPFNDYRPRTQQVIHLEPFFIVTKTLHSRVHPVYALKRRYR